MLNYHKPFSTLYYKVCNTELKTPYTIYHFTAYKFERNSRCTVFNEFITNAKYSEDEKKIFTSIYHKTWNIYKLFTILYNDRLTKKMTLYSCSRDLNFEPMSNIKDKYKFSFSQKNKIYTFTVKDMIRIIKNGLLNHDHYFSDPKIAKNPYNNVVLSKTILYNFYFYLLNSNILIPECLRRFFKAGFVCRKFFRDNQFYLREQIINNYTSELTHDELYEEIILLLRSLKVNMYIHIDYSKMHVIEKCEKIFICYLHTQYNLSNESKHYYSRKMNHLIKAIMNSDNMFGRVMVKKRYNKEEYPHWNYKYHNLLDPIIPKFDSLDEIYHFMEHGTILMNDDNEDSDDDDEEDEEPRDISPLPRNSARQIMESLMNQIEETLHTELDIDN